VRSIIEKLICGKEKMNFLVGVLGGLIGGIAINFLIMQYYNEKIKSLQMQLLALRVELNKEFEESQ
jgi:hypothetical protein